MVRQALPVPGVALREAVARKVEVFGHVANGIGFGEEVALVRAYSSSLAIPIQFCPHNLN